MTTSTEKYFEYPEYWKVGYYYPQKGKYYTEQGFPSFDAALKRLSFLNRAAYPVGIQSLKLEQLIDKELPADTQAALDELDRLFELAVMNDS